MWKFPEILVLSSSEAMRNSLAEALRLSGMNPIPCATLTESSTVLAQTSVSAIFCDDCLCDGTYRDLVAMIRGEFPEIPIVVVSPFGDWNEYLKALGAGAFDYVGIPFRQGEIERVVQSALVEHLQRKLVSDAEKMARA
jgi:two-component system response regulator PilR (NtrC family)